MQSPRRHPYRPKEVNMASKTRSWALSSLAETSSVAPLARLPPASLRSTGARKVCARKALQAEPLHDSTTEAHVVSMTATCSGHSGRAAAHQGFGLDPFWASGQRPGRKAGGWPGQKKKKREQDGRMARPVESFLTVQGFFGGFRPTPSYWRRLPPYMAHRPSASSSSTGRHTGRCTLSGLPRECFFFIPRGPPLPPDANAICACRTCNTGQAHCIRPGGRSYLY